MKPIRSIADIKTLGLSMVKFAATSLLGTAADFLSFTFVFRAALPTFYAELCAAFIGMVINFFMQKKFVFSLNRKASTAFLLSIGMSLVLMLFGAYALAGMESISFFAENLLVAKVFVMGAKFVLNYFTKRWVFEKR